MSKWERVDKDTDRMKVPGGWVVRVVWDVEGSSSVTSALCYVPDPEHKWEIEGGE